MAFGQGRRWWPGSLLYLVGLISWIVAIYWAAALAVKSDEPPQGLVIVIAMVAMMGMPVHVVMHEVGHLVVALAAGLRVTEVAVLSGPATRVRTIARTRVRIGWRGRQTHVRLSAPLDLTAVRARTIVVVAAGPLVNIATAFACWGIGEAAVDVLVRALWFAVGAGAAALGVANLVPAKAPEAVAGMTDGLLIVRWLIRPEGLRTALALEYLAWRGRDPGNRWRRYEDLRAAPPGARSPDVVLQPRTEPSPTEKH